MKSGTYSQSTSKPGLVLLAEVLLGVGTACGQLERPYLHEHVLEGEQFAHRLDFPARFQHLDASETALRFSFDHYGFRVSAGSPDVLLVAACRYSDLSKTCSANSFAIDTAHGYTVREASRSEWEQGLPIDGVRYMRGGPVPEPPYRNLRTLGREGYYPDGYEYGGKTYLRRGDWIATYGFAASSDNKLVLLAGVDKRKLPKQGFLGDPINAGAYGTFTLDIFDSQAGRIAALDVDCKGTVADSFRHVTLVNSRWLAISLNFTLSKMLLLDFKPSQGGQAR